MPLMNSSYSNEAELLRAEIAAAAARMIAEDGTDYGGAKRKAVKQILGNRKIRGDVMPDNAQIEAEVRIYNELFFGDTQPARLRHLRLCAIELMRGLEQFSPFVVGAVANGTAGAHSEIHLHLFTESAKDVEIHLLNRDIDFSVSEGNSVRPRSEPVEILSFMWQGEGVHLSLFATDDIRTGSKLGRTDMRSLQELLSQSE